MTSSRKDWPNAEGRALPALVELVTPALAGQVSEPEVVAMTLVRLAVCHYLVPGYDDPRQLASTGGRRRTGGHQ